MNNIYIFDIYLLNQIVWIGVYRYCACFQYTLKMNYIIYLYVYNLKKSKVTNAPLQI